MISICIKFEVGVVKVKLGKETSTLLLPMLVVSVQSEEICAEMQVESRF